MEVVDTQLLNIGLNVLGYLVAAALGMLVYSAFLGRRRQPAPVPLSAPVASENEAPAAEPPAPSDVNSGYEFVDLRQTATSVERDADEPQPKDKPGHRDRPEIIRLAREMVKAGTSGEMIKRTLPISDVELALLQTGNIK